MLQYHAVISCFDGVLDSINSRLLYIHLRQYSGRDIMFVNFNSYDFEIYCESVKICLEGKHIPMAHKAN